MGKKPTISVRVYKGKRMSYDAKGQALNENQSIKYVHNTIEWKNFLKNLTANGYCKVEVESVNVVETVKTGNSFEDKISDYDDTKSIENELSEAFKNQTEIKLTPEQQRIADLEARIDALTGGKKEPKKEEKPKKEKKAENKEEKDERSVRDIYIDELGKNPFNGWSEEQMMEKIEEHRASKK